MRRVVWAMVTIGVCVGYGAPRGTVSQAEVTVKPKLLHKFDGVIEAVCLVGGDQVAVSYSEFVALVDLRSGKVNQTITLTPLEIGSSLAYDAHAQILWIGGVEGGLYRAPFKGKTAQPLETIIDSSDRIGGPSINGLCITPTGKIIFGNGDDGEVYLGSADASSRIRVDGSSMRFAALSADGRRYFAVMAGGGDKSYSDGKLIAIDVETKQVLFSRPAPDAQDITLNSEGNLLLASKGGLDLISSESGKVIAHAPKGDVLLRSPNLAITSDGKALVIPTDAGLRVVDAMTPVERLHLIRLPQSVHRNVGRVFPAGTDGVLWIPDDEVGEIYRLDLPRKRK